MGFAFQWRVADDGLVDGATAFAWPESLPAEGETVALPGSAGTATRTNGVVVFTLAAGVDLGTIDLTAVPGVSAQLGWWLKAFHFEMSDAGAAPPRAARASLINVPNLWADVDEKVIVPDYEGSGGGIDEEQIPVQLMSCFNGCFVPFGCSMRLLTDDTDGTFAGAPANGPLNLFVELEPIADDAMLSEVLDLADVATRRSIEHGELVEYSAVDLATLPTEHLQILRNGGTLIAAWFVALGGFAAGESLTVITPTGGEGLQTTIDNSNYDPAFAGLPFRMTPGVQETRFFQARFVAQTDFAYVPGGTPSATAATVRLLWSPCRHYIPDGSIPWVVTATLR